MSKLGLIKAAIVVRRIIISRCFRVFVVLLSAMFTIASAVKAAESEQQVSKPDLAMKLQNPIVNLVSVSLQ